MKKIKQTILTALIVGLVAGGLVALANTSTEQLQIIAGILVGILALVTVGFGVTILYETIGEYLDD